MLASLLRWSMPGLSSALSVADGAGAGVEMTNINSTISACVPLRTPNSRGRMEQISALRPPPYNSPEPWPPSCASCFPNPIETALQLPHLVTASYAILPANPISPGPIRMPYRTILSLLVDTEILASPSSTGPFQNQAPQICVGGLGGLDLPKVLKSQLALALSSPLRQSRGLRGLGRGRNQSDMTPFSGGRKPPKGCLVRRARSKPPVSYSLGGGLRSGGLWPDPPMP